MKLSSRLLLFLHSFFYGVLLWWYFGSLLWFVVPVLGLIYFAIGVMKHA